MTTLTPASFDLLLSALDGKDRTNAAEKYELLRLKLIKCFTWRKNCPDSEADALADIVLDRLALKVSQGHEIQNINAYACMILEYVWKEHVRRHKEDAVGPDKMPELAAELNEAELFGDPDLRMRCLRKCMAEVVPHERDRMLIIGYYDADASEKIKDRRRDLAEKLGLTMTNLKVRALRLRDRIEKCINDCVSRLSVTKTSGPVTNIGGDRTNE